MAPRCGKRRRRVRNPVPLWIPLPRPCLRSLNIPDPPCYVPLSPGIYLPQWALPPSCFRKRMCLCANEDFCTTSNCLKSNECVKMPPLLCPYGTKDDETSDLQSQLGHDQQQINDVPDSSLNSNTNICSSCELPTSKSSTSNKKRKFNHNRPKPESYKFIRTQESSEQSDPGAGHNIDLVGRNISNGVRNVGSRDRYDTELDYKSSGMLPSRDSVQKSSLSRLLKNNKTTSEDHIENSSNKNKTHANNSEHFVSRYVSPTIKTCGVPCNTQNEFNNRACAEFKNSQTNYFENNSDSQNEFIDTKTKLATDTIHVDHLPEQISDARKRKVSKYSGCCFSGSEKNCKTAIENDTMIKPIMEKPNYDTTKSHRKSECGCHSVDKPVKESSKPLKPSYCICSSNKVSSKETSRFRKISKCKCSSDKKSHNKSSKSHKFTECGCSSTKIFKTPASSRKVSESSCSSSNAYDNTSRKSRKTSEHELISNEVGIPNKSLPTEPTNLTVTDLRQLGPPGCLCKFPPAYKHLSCTGINDNCSCTKNIKKDNNKTSQ